MPAKVDKEGEVTLEGGPKVKTDTSDFKTGDRCFAVVRPEKLWVDLAKEKPPPGQPSVEGVLESSLYLGTATQMQVRLGEDVLMTVLCPNTNDAERESLPGPGANVKLSWAPEHMHLVRDTGAANGELTASANHDKEAKP
jgi:hypothetical protein